MKRIITTLTLVILCFTAKAQDPEFTQFYVNSMYLNPALVGSNPCPTFTSMYRNQYPSISGNYISTSLSYDATVESTKGGVGFMIMNDKAGPTILSTFGLSAAYSVNQQISRSLSIRMAFQGSFYQEYLDASKFKFPDQIDPVNGFVLPTADFVYEGAVYYGTIGVGGLISSDKYFLGYAVTNLNTPNQSLLFGNSQLPIKHTIHAGALLPIRASNTEVFDWSPNIIYRQQGTSKQLNAGLNINTKPLIAGVWYRGIVFAERYSDAVIFSLGVKLSDLNFMYSYDLTISEISPAAGGAHEVSLIYKLPCSKKRNRGVNAVPCTYFFN